MTCNRIKMASGFLFMMEHNVVPLDNTLLNQLHNWFYGDRTVTKIRQNVLPLVFPEGMKIKNGKNINMQGRFVEDVIKRAHTIIDYKNMFGFCPFIIYKDNVSGEFRFSVPDFGSGTFNIKIDPFSFETTVHFIPKNEIAFNTSVKKLTHSVNTNSEETTNYVEERFFEVFSWKDMTPNFYTRALKSPLWSAFIEWIKVDEFEQYALSTEFRGAQPEVFLVSNASQLLSDQKRLRKEVSVADDFLIAETESEERIAMNYYTTESLKQSVESAITFERTPDMRKVFSPEHGTLQNKTKRNMSKGPMTVLPYGTTIQAGPNFSTSKQEDEKKRLLEEDILQIFGIPLSMIKGMTSGAKYSLSAISALEREQFNKTILKWRSEFKNFLQTVLSLLITLDKSNPFDKLQSKTSERFDIERENLNKHLTHGNIGVNDFISVTQALEQNKKDLDKWLNNMKSMKDLEIVYPIDQNLRVLSMEDAITLFHEGALLPEEFLYLSRELLGLGGLQELVAKNKDGVVPKELIKLLTLGQKRKEEELKLPVVPPKPTVGNAPTSTAATPKPVKKKSEGGGEPKPKKVKL